MCTCQLTYYYPVKELIKIGGVPEHFNLPWQLAIEKNLFAINGIHLEWSFYAGGTGDMTKALSRGDLDMAILLTEGYFSALHQGLEAQVVKVHIDSPLVWGIYTGADSDIFLPHANQYSKTAISRFGSGSHLMAMIDASQHHRKMEKEDFVVVSSLLGAIDSLVAHETGYFYWEKFMTRPFVVQGLVRLIGDFSAPWSGFLVVAGNDAMKKKAELIHTILSLMNTECEKFRLHPDSALEISRRFEMTEEESADWLKETVWNTGFSANKQSFLNARNALAAMGLSNPGLNINECCAEWLQLE